MKALFLGTLALLTAGASFAYDSTIVYTGGSASCVFRLNGKRDQEIRKDVPEAVIFPGGLKISHLVLPRVNLSCTYENRVAIKVDTGGFYGKMGRVKPEVDWEGAVQFPVVLQPLDSLIDWLPYSGPAPAEAFMGMGLLHSRVQTDGCRLVYLVPQSGYDRLIYFRNTAAKVFMKLQVQAFELDKAGCPADSTEPCSDAKNVLIRYEISDDRYFQPATTVERKPGANRIRTAISHRLYDWILGRNPAIR